MEKATSTVAMYSGAVVWWLSLLHNFIQQSLRFCAVSNSACVVLEICDGEVL